MSIKNNPIMLVSLAALMLFCVQCRENSKAHEVIGKWEAQNQAISFYEDGLASVNGVSARWRPIDRSSVRLELEDTVMEFAISSDGNGEPLGKLSLGGQEVIPLMEKKPAVYRKSR